MDIINKVTKWKDEDVNEILRESRPKKSIAPIDRQPASDTSTPGFKKKSVDSPGFPLGGQLCSILTSIPC